MNKQADEQANIGIHWVLVSTENLGLAASISALVSVKSGPGR